MIVITKIDCVELPENPARLCTTETLFSETGVPVEVREVMKLVRGQRYVHPLRGIDVIVGVSDEVGEALGITLEVHENMRREIEALREQIIKANYKVALIESYGFWKRLKCLFVGIK